MKFSVAQFLKKDLVRNTLWMLAAQGVGLGMQIAYFVVLARALGVEEYGVFVAITAFAAVVMPFVGLGLGDLLIKEVSRRGAFREYWGNALGVMGGVSALLMGWMVFGAMHWLPRSIHPLTILLILLSDMLFLNLWDLCGKAFLAIDRVSLAARVKVLLNFTKLSMAVLFFLFFREAGIEGWAGLYLLSTMMAAIGGIVWVTRLQGAPRLALGRVDFLQGFYFSVGESASSINAGIDQTMLASLSTLEATGAYAAAYRCIAVGYLGLHAIGGATYARFFQQGEEGIRGSLRFARRLLPVVCLYGMGTCLGFLLFAPYVPRILGAEYLGAVEAIRWLAIVPLLLSLQFLVSDALTGAGFQGMRSGIQVCSAVCNVGLNFGLIPLYSWKGAAIATLVAEGLKLIGLCGVAMGLALRGEENFELKRLK
jgi:O-antigen/teichoic acid export membrane protein